MRAAPFACVTLIAVVAASADDIVDLMNLGRLLVYFEGSPAIRLLRAQHAPYVISFLYQQFKQSDAITRPQSELLAALGSFQENFSDVLRDKPETYLSGWCSGDKRWLHRFYEAGRVEPVYQLTPDLEEVIEFLDRALEQDMGFVGTESRLTMVIDALEALVVGASDDPAVHLDHLRREKERIERRIERIEEAGTVAPYEPARIREQFATAVSLLKQLQGDFRAVEEKFKQITQDVQQRQIYGSDSRGGILAGALDAEEALQREDQGISFYGFFRFIQSPQQQDRLRAIIQQLGRIRELLEQVEGLDTVRRMMPLLLAEANKVTQTERRLSTTLRRLLDSRAQRERQRVAELLRDIRGMAASLASNPPRDTVSLAVEATIAIGSPFSRTFWSEPPEFEQVDLTEHVADDARRHDAFLQFAQMQRLDFKGMRTRIDDAVGQHGHLTLRQLLDEHPPDSGVIDILGYVQIAGEDGHLISRDAQEELILPPRNGDRRSLAVKVPLVTFVGRARR